MDILGKKLWQVAAGDTDRHYAHLCLKWDVILDGPGSKGPWPSCAALLRDERRVSTRKVTDLRRFSEGISDGDIVALRVGTSEVYGVGVVVGGYEWCAEFGDVDGWELEHVRRVRWVWKADPAPRRFDGALKFGDTVQPLNHGPVRDWISEMQVDSAELTRPLAEMPGAFEDVGLDVISDYLFDQGMASASIHTLLHEIGELVRVARWYQRVQHGPSESETIAYLVAPLLRALGWTPQTMAIEWNHVDVALFSHLPRHDENLSAVVEAKPKGSSCLNAKSQAQHYAEQTGRATCQRLVVTDGLRYGIFIREEGGFTSEPRAYLNLTRMRSAHPIYGCDGAKEAFWLMSPYWRHIGGKS